MLIAVDMPVDIVIAIIVLPKVFGTDRPEQTV